LIRNVVQSLQAFDDLLISTAVELLPNLFEAGLQFILLHSCTIPEFLDRPSEGLRRVVAPLVFPEQKASTQPWISRISEIKKKLLLEALAVSLTVLH
jgi:hypothetical protein